MPTLLLLKSVASMATDGWLQMCIAPRPMAGKICEVDNQRCESILAVLKACKVAFEHNAGAAICCNILYASPDVFPSFSDRILDAISPTDNADHSRIFGIFDGFD